MRYTIVGTGTQAIGQAGKPKGLRGDHWITLPVMWFLGGSESTERCGVTVSLRTIFSVIVTVMRLYHDNGVPAARAGVRRPVLA